MFPVSCSQFLFPKIIYSPRSAHEQYVIYWRLQRAAWGYIGPANNKLNLPLDVSMVPKMVHDGGRGMVSLPSFILISASLVLSILPFHSSSADIHYTRGQAKNPFSHDCSILLCSSLILIFALSSILATKTKAASLPRTRTIQKQGSVHNRTPYLFSCWVFKNVCVWVQTQYNGVLLHRDGELVARHLQAPSFVKREVQPLPMIPPLHAAFSFLAFLGKGAAAISSCFLSSSLSFPGLQLPTKLNCFSGPGWK